MAYDDRFSLVLVGSSGKGGATLLRRNYGEGVENLATGEYYWLDGNCYIFAEDSDVEVPIDVGHEIQKEKKAIIDDDGNAIEEEEDVATEHEDREERELAYYQKHYKGWDRLVLLPVEQIKLTTFNFTDKEIIELIPSDRDKTLIEQASVSGTDPVITVGKSTGGAIGFGELDPAHIFEM